MSLKKKLLIRVGLFAGLLFAVNTYAWFIYIDKFDGVISADVISWDITFYDDSEDINSIALNINELFPGMPDYNKSIVVSNSSDMSATFEYEVKSIKLFGIEYTNVLAIENILNNSLPFKITFSKNKDIIQSGGDHANFIINVKWDFEQENPYWKINDLYEYNEYINYYKKINNEYVIDDTINSSTFSSNINNLYIESDDADTYWGTKAAIFKNEHPSTACLSINMDLIVTQNMN